MAAAGHGPAHLVSTGEDDRASSRSGISSGYPDLQVTQSLGRISVPLPRVPERISEQASEDLRRLRELEAEAAALRRRLRHAETSSLETPRSENSSTLAYRTQGRSRNRPGNLATPSGGGRPLAVVISMVGLGDDFVQAGFRMPRPLLSVVGRPVLLWLLDNLNFQRQDLLFLVLPSVFERQYNIGKTVAREFPMLNLQVITLPFETRGWVETIFSVTRQMQLRDLKLPLVTLDCSTVFHGIDVLQRCRDVPDGCGASFYFDAEEFGTIVQKQRMAPSRFSYVKLDAEGFITTCVEKQVISNFANVGGYLFKCARDFRSAAEQFLESSSENGLYAVNLMQAMIKDHHRFVGIRVEDAALEIVAAPAGLQRFIQRISNGTISTDRRMRFCFDLDGTLVTEPRVPGDLSTCEPLPNAIALVRELHAAGHTIIITTSRGMEVGRGKDVALAETGRATFATLAHFDIPFHDLHFGKPYADVYIDSHTLNSQGDIERDLGWRVHDSHVSNEGVLEGAVDARAFNLVRAKGKDHVIKSSTPSVLRGECHWYRSIPPTLSKLFPEPLEVVEGDQHVSLSSITMTKVSGPTFSHLSTARLLLNAAVRQMVGALHSIHTCVPSEGSPVAQETKVTVHEMCSNYATKVRQRYEKHGDLYRQLGIETGLDTARMFHAVADFLDNFEAQEGPLHSWYIHGDPVFSNVIRTSEEGIVFIDMRGELGKKLTTQGDIHYDLSKVFQSLCGYDFMLLDQVLDETSSAIFDELRATYWDEVRKLYPGIVPRDVRLHTAAHFFAIVPLHEVRSRMQRYLRTCNSMLAVEGLV